MSLPAKSRADVATRLEVVADLTSLINRTFDLDEMFRAAILSTARAIPFRRASVAVVSPDQTTYYLHTLYDSDRGGFQKRDVRFPLDQGLPGRAIRTGHAIREDQHSGNEDIQTPDEGSVSVLVVPLQIDGTVIGTLNFGAKESDRYDDADLELAVILGRQLSTSLRLSKLLKTIDNHRAALEEEHAEVTAVRRRLEALIDASDAATLMVRHGYVVHVNQPMAKLVGRTRESLENAPITEVHAAIQPRLADPKQLAVEAATIKGGNDRINDRIEFREPVRQIYQRTVAPVLDENESVLGHVVIYRDVTREAEAQLAKDEFVSLVSHELRTPLTSVQTSLHLLDKTGGDRLTDQMRDFVSIATRNLDRLIRLVNDLLDLARMQRGHFVAVLTPVSPALAAHRALDAVAGFADSRQISLDDEGPEDAPSVNADPDRLEQVLVNLLSNAIKFSEPGRPVTIRWSVENKSVIFEVRDQGPGIPEAQRDQIFAEFHQLDPASTRAHGGAGLGLAISHSIVKQFGGELWVESEVGKGSQFFVRLRLATVNESL